MNRWASIVRPFLVIWLGAASFPLHAAPRPYLMGTSTFADFFEFKYENLDDKDMISVHIDDFIGVPWDEFRDGTPPPQPWVTRVETIRSGAAASGKVVFLSLGPLGGRKTLASKVDATGAPVQDWAPVDANGCYAFGTDPGSAGYKQGYINYVKYMIDRFHPQYLAIVIELNVQFTHCPSHKAAFKQWYADVYAAIKADQPLLPVFATFQTEHMYGMADDASWCGGARTDASLAACFQQRLDEMVAMPGDRAAFSMYPANWKYPPNTPDTRSTTVPYEDLFRRVQATTNRRIWISETGWGAVQIFGSYQHAAPASVCGPVLVPTPIVNGEANMADHMAQLLSQAQSKQFEGVVWWGNRDYLDAATADTCPCVGDNFTCNTSETLYTQAGGGQAGYTLEFSWRSFGNMGLRYKNGSPRNAVYSIWKTYFDQSFVSGDTLNRVQVYPNPYRPARGHEGMNFTALPGDSRIRIYTLSGEKVRTLSANAIGTAFWNGRNESGEPVASGVYFALLEHGGNKRTIKVAVQR